MSGWVSYGFISSKRKWMDYTELAPSPFDITHNLAIVLKANIMQSLQFGLTYKYATGRPYTEIVGADYHPEQRVYEPIKGATNSARHQNYIRLDLGLTHLTKIFGDNFAAFTIEGLNILNIENIFGYNYSPDYSEKKDIRSYFGKRLVVVEIQLGF
jgi:vitamin B12 transporter